MRSRYNGSSNSELTVTLIEITANAMLVSDTLCSPDFRLYHQTAIDFAVGGSCPLLSLVSSHHDIMLLEALFDNMGHWSATYSYNNICIACPRGN